MRETAAVVMRRINQIWLDGKVEELAPLVHPEIVMAFPGFTGQIRGRETFLGGFRDFCQNTRIHEFRDQEYQVDEVGDVAVVTFRFEMVYERAGETYRSTGRDFWVFQGAGESWITVWRTMLDVDEKPV